MIMTFRGYRRHVYTHKHLVNPRPHDTSVPSLPLEWESATTANGRITDLGLSGDFRVQFEFEESELRNWLEKYVEEKPARGLALINAMQAKAILSLVEKE